MSSVTADRIKLANLYDDLDARIKSLAADKSKVHESRLHVDKALKGKQALYGINTGFGVLARKRISDAELEELQKNLILSHAVGTGSIMPKCICKLMLQLKIHSLGLGYSGVSCDVLERLIYFINNDLIPASPTKGSVGASGDLVPLAHMSLTLLGLGRFYSGDQLTEAEKVYQEKQIKPVQLKPKDGLALLNGTQQMLAYGSYVLHAAMNLVKLADVVAATSIEALHGSDTPFDERIHAVRPHEGQMQVAENLRQLLSDSEIRESHRGCDKVQDPYSLRCVPQVHGASRDALQYCNRVIETEINSVTDNPLVFSDGDILSGGNFHGQPLALALDFAAMALSELANISERRTYLLLSGQDGLPELLMKETGVNSGFMIPQYTAAALVSDNKVLCHPASVDSIPTCNGQEDHVSMGAMSARKLYSVFRNVHDVLAVEALTAAQALDFRLPMKAGAGVMKAHDFIRQHIKHNDKDYLINKDLGTISDLIRKGDIISQVEKSIGELN